MRPPMLLDVTFNICWNVAVELGSDKNRSKYVMYSKAFLFIFLIETGDLKLNTYLIDLIDHIKFDKIISITDFSQKHETPTNLLYFLWILYEGPN